MKKRKCRKIIEFAIEMCALSRQLQRLKYDICDIGYTLKKLSKL